LRDRAVEILAGRIWNFVTFKLQGSEMGELLADAGVETRVRGLHLRLGDLRRETTAKIARARERGHA
jgi:hypothetical protein